MGGYGNYKKNKFKLIGAVASTFILLSNASPTFASSYEYDFIEGYQILGTTTRGKSGSDYYGGARTTVSTNSILTKTSVGAQFGDGYKSNYSDYYYGSSYIQVTSRRGLPSSVKGTHWAKGFNKTVNFISNIN